MRKLLNLTLGCAFALALIFPVGAAERKGKKGTKTVDRSRQQDKLQGIVVSGKIEKKMRTGKDRKTGQKKTLKRYVLIDAEGTTVYLPKSAKDSDIDFEDYVGKQVTVKGQGLVRTRKRLDKKEKRISIRTIGSIEEADADMDKEPAADMENDDE